MKHQVAATGASTRRMKAGKGRARSVRKVSAGVTRVVHQLVRSLLFSVLGVMSYLTTRCVRSQKKNMVKRPAGAYQMRVRGGATLPAAFSLSAMTLRVSGIMPSCEAAMMSHLSKS